MVNQQAILRRCRWIAPLVVTVLAGGSLVQAEWRVRPIAAPYGLTDRDTTVVYRLEDSSGDLVTEPGVRFTLTVGGSGVFGSESGSGTILEGANTSRVVVEFEEGLVVLPLRAGTAESLELFGSDPETRGIGFAGFYADFERDNGGFQPGTNGWEWGAPTSGPRRAVSGERVWATNLEGGITSPFLSGLWSAPVRLNAVSDLRVEFQSWIFVRSPGGSVSVRSGGATVTLGTLATDTRYVARSLPLVGYGGREVQVGFGTPLFSSGWPGWFIDDFAVIGASRQIEFLTPQGDADGDGLGNEDELEAGADPRRADTDGDGVADGRDVCPTTLDALQLDRVHPGGPGDACEDPDLDGVPDSADACPDVPDPDQANADADRLGDACDPFPELDLHVRVSTPAVAFTDGSTGIELELFDRAGTLRSELGDVRITLEVTGSATFASVARQGAVLDGGGTRRVRVQFVSGRVVIDLEDSIEERVRFRGDDSDDFGLDLAGVFEDFELDGGGFQPSPYWQRGTPLGGPGMAYSGTNVWATHLDGQPTGVSQMDLTTPSYRLDLNSSPSVEFQSWLDIYPTQDVATLQLSRNGAAYVDVASSTGASGGYVLRSYDLAPYAGSDVRFRFRLNGPYYFPKRGWFIDDFRLRGTSVEVEFIHPDTDIDSDGLTAREEIERGTDRTDADSENDTVLDNVDNCPLSWNPVQEDHVHPNGQGDACDDPDGDRVPDALDVCPDTADPQQLNRDQDGLGDACDALPDDILWVRPMLAGLGLSDRGLTLSLRLENHHGLLQAERTGVRYRLSLRGPAVFGASARRGVLLAGGGTDEVLIEFAQGLVELDIVPLGIGSVSLRGAAEPEMPLYFASVFEDFEANDGGFTVQGGLTGLWKYGIPTAYLTAASGAHLWGIRIDGGSPYPEEGFLVSPEYPLAEDTFPAMLFASWTPGNASTWVSAWSRQADLGSRGVGSSNSSSYGSVFLHLRGGAGQTARVSFGYDGSYASSAAPWFIDDFAILDAGKTIQFLAPDEDPDQDGWTNSHELQAGANPFAGDTDGDSIGDPQDNCPATANTDQSDVLRPNGVGDDCDDPDRDGVADRTDNCRDVSNAPQTDTDGDGVGDSCDPAPESILHVVPEAPEFALVGAPVVVTYRLVDKDGVSMSDLDGIRVELTVSGSATFGTQAEHGVLLHGGGSNRIRAQFVGGRFAIALSAPMQDQCVLGGGDTDGLGLVVYSKLVRDFEAYHGGFTHSGTSDSWEYGEPTSGPSRAASGRRLWATNLDGLAPTASDAFLVSPPVRLTPQGPHRIVFNSWLSVTTCCSAAQVDVKPVGSSTWSNPWRDGGLGQTFERESIDLSPFFAGKEIQVRFRLRLQGSSGGPGWYVDDFEVHGIEPSIAFVLGQADLDGDGVTNADELARGSRADHADTDGDAIPDAIDNCPVTVNPDQRDTRSPGATGDACDDTDGDGVVESEDNCPLVANADQADLDADHVGNACDLHPELALFVTASIPRVALAGEPALVTYELLDDAGRLQSELGPVRTVLTLAGSAVFTADVHHGRLLSNPGSSRADVEFVSGRLTIAIVDPAIEEVALGAVDEHRVGLAFRGRILEDFETDDGGFRATGAWRRVRPDREPYFAVSGDHVWRTELTSDRSWHCLESPKFAISDSSPSRLSFQSWFDGYAEVQVDYGFGFWNEVEILDGRLEGYAEKAYELAPIGGEAQVRLCYGQRFDVDGWFVDDFVVDRVPIRVKFLASASDLDGDGLTNGQERAAGTDPYRPDSDLDGVPDLADNCPCVANRDQSNRVHAGGTGDACDDPDHDGWSDDADNCPDDPNTDQANTDGDRVGSACDPFPDLDLKIRPSGPQLAFAGEPIRVTYRIENPAGLAVEALPSVRTTLTLSGSATFASSAEIGTLIGGGGSNRIEVEFEQGQFAIDVFGHGTEIVRLGGEDTDSLGIEVLSDVFDDFELGNGGFVRLEDVAPGQFEAPYSSSQSTAGGSSGPVAIQQDLVADETLSAPALTVATWQHGSTGSTMAAASGTKLWGTGLNLSQLVASDVLLTPAFELPTSVPSVAQFESWFSTPSDPLWFGGHVLILARGEASWQRAELVPLGAYYQTRAIDLTPHAGKDVRLAFYFYAVNSVNATGWKIDDFRLRTGGLAIRVFQRDGDEDGDGLPNGVELAAGDDPFNRDMDRDGVLDGVDNCRRVSNYRQEDEVHVNGIGDACDDPDFDEVADAHDNCPDAANADQLDKFRFNGIGDACDDPDEDGLADLEDNCRNASNPDQQDFDHDASGDACDTCPAVSNREQFNTAACVELIEDGGRCLQTRLELLDRDDAGDLEVLRIDKPPLDRLVFEVLAGAYAANEFIEFSIDGTVVGSVAVPLPDQTTQLHVLRHTVSDPTILGAMWDAEDHAKIGVRLSSYLVGMSWMRVEMTTGARSAATCALGDCAGNGPIVGAPSSPIWLERPFVETQRVSTQVFSGADSLSEVDLSALPDGAARACVTTEAVPTLLTVDFLNGLQGFDLRSSFWEFLGRPLDRASALAYDPHTGRAVVARGNAIVQFDVRTGKAIQPVLHTAAPIVRLVFIDSTLYATSGGVPVDWHRVNLDTGELELLGMAPLAEIDSLAYEEATRTLYVAARPIPNSSTRLLYEMDPRDATVVQRTPLQDDVRSIGVGLGGKLSAAVRSFEYTWTDELHELDPADGSHTDTGVVLNNYTSDFTFVESAPRRDCFDFTKRGERVLAINGTPCDGDPVAVAGAGAEIECTSAGGTLVTLDGSASSDPDSTPGTNDDIVLFEWIEDLGTTSERLLGSGESLAIMLPLGRHAITLRVTDSGGVQGQDATAFDVVDTVPPTLELALAPTTLWPPNHRMVPLTVTARASDACGTARVWLASVSSSEPDDDSDAADGETARDIQDVRLGEPDFELSLRAERDGDGPGRVYDVVYRAEDVGGHVVEHRASVWVPHDQRGATDPIDLRMRKAPTGSVLSWQAVPGAMYYNVIRGNLEKLRATTTHIELGAVQCVSARLTSLAAPADPVDPSPGRAWFYLAEYEDGWHSSYSSESAGRPSLASSGACP